jgi:signal transduction histidine kinase
MEAVGQLTGGVAHDFNNLLNVVLINLDRVERRLPADSPLRAPLRDAMQGAERGAAVTHKLLAFARKHPLTPVRTDVNARIGSFAELLRGSIGAQIRLETDLAPDLPALVIDQNQLENAILNLAVNARDAMPDGGTLTIRTRPLAAEGLAQEGLAQEGLAKGTAGVCVEVSDTGTGMPPEVEARAFEPFFTTKPLGQGTGLGLSQVFGFAQQSGGSATILTGGERGTTVRLCFPAEPLPAPAPAPDRAEAPSLGLAPGFAVAG